MAVTLAIAGCGSEGSRQAAADRHAAETARGSTQLTSRVARDAARPFVRDCASRVEGGRLDPGPKDIRVGPVVFYGLREAGRASPGEFDRRPGFGLYWKTVTEVAAKARAMLTVVPEDRDHVTLTYNGSGSGRNGVRLRDGVAAVRFDACPPGEPRFSGPGTVGARTQFNGGFAVREAGCYGILVRGYARRQVLRRRVAFGRSEAGCVG